MAWELEKTGAKKDCIMFGVNIFHIDWNETKQSASVRDPDSGMEMLIPVYTVDINGKTLTFAAGELQDGRYGFYLWSNEPRGHKRGKPLKLSHIILLIVGAIAFAFLITIAVSIAFSFGSVAQPDMMLP